MSLVYVVYAFVFLLHAAREELVWDISNQILERGLIIALMPEAASTSETSVNFYQATQSNIPENSHLQV
jgi:hypothetical protein